MNKLTALKAALNLALNDRLVRTDEGWKTITPFKDVDDRRKHFTRHASQRCAPRRVSFFVGLELRYTKPPIGIGNQIALLKQRGMQFADDNHARHTLANINYYRLRAYWLPFENEAGSGEDYAFLLGAPFEDVLAHYAFDQRLKLLLLDAIERVEISLRTRWAHGLALTYGSHETFIKHYLETYTEPTMPPIWVVCEVMTLGQLSQWIDNLKRRNDRQAIAQLLGFDEVVALELRRYRPGRVVPTVNIGKQKWPESYQEPVVGFSGQWRPAMNQSAIRPLHNLTNAYFVPVTVIPLSKKQPISWGALLWSAPQN